MEKHPESTKFIFIGTVIIALSVVMMTTLNRPAGIAVLGMGAILFIVGMKKKKEEDLKK